MQSTKSGRASTFRASVEIRAHALIEKGQATPEFWNTVSQNIHCLIEARGQTVADFRERYLLGGIKAGFSRPKVEDQLSGVLNGTSTEIYGYMAFATYLGFPSDVILLKRLKEAMQSWAISYFDPEEWEWLA